jgi:hypothetical protein
MDSKSLKRVGNLVTRDSGVTGSDSAANLEFWIVRLGPSTDGVLPAVTGRVVAFLKRWQAGRVKEVSGLP